MLVASVARSTSCPSRLGNQSSQSNQLRQLASQVDQVVMWSLGKYHTFVVIDAVGQHVSPQYIWSRSGSGVRWVNIVELT